MEKIWLLVKEDDCFIDTIPFHKKEDAEKEFNRIREEQLKWASEDDVQTDEYLCLEIYQDGCYNDGHFSMSVRELDVR